MMKAYARFAGVLSIVAAGGFAGCAQHAPPMDLDVESIEERPQFMRHARGEEPEGQRLPQRCALTQAPEATPLRADEGWGRSTIRVQTDDGLRELPLQESSFETLVVGTVAETTVTQVFANPFNEPIEAVYAFPLHERAAVDDDWIHVVERSLHGEIHRREEGEAGQGTIGLGSTGLIGKGGGGGSGSGYGRGAGAGFGGRGKRVPRVRHAKAQVTGALDREVIRRVVRAHNNSLRACYEPMLELDPSASFKVSIGFVIDSEGRVTAALTWSDASHSETEKVFDVCLTAALERIRFPKPAGGGTVKVRYPLVFQPG